MVTSVLLLLFEYFEESAIKKFFNPFIRKWFLLWLISFTSNRQLHLLILQFARGSFRLSRMADKINIKIVYC